MTALRPGCEVDDPIRGRICLITGATSGIRAATGNEDVHLLLAELSSQASIRELARDFRNQHERLHALVNCAGALFRDRRVTVDGLERTFALNHLAYFQLTKLLLDVL